MSKVSRALALTLVLAILVALAWVPMAARSQVPTSLALALIKPTFNAFAFWGLNETQPLLAYPGASYMPLTALVIYMGPSTLYNVTIRMNVSSPLELVSGEPEPSLKVPLLEPGTELKLIGLFNVSPSASLGLYNETLNVTYTELVKEPITNTTIMIRSWELVNLPVPVVGFVNIRLLGFRTEPPVIYAGINASLITVYLVNTGNVMASNVTVTLVSPGPVEPLEQGYSTVRLGYLPPGRPVNITFPLRLGNVTRLEYLAQPSVSVRVPSSYNTTLRLIVSGDGFNETLDVPVKVYPRAYFTIVNSYHDSVSAGASNTYITVTMINVGGAQAKYLVAALMPNSIFKPYIPSSENPVVALTAFNYTVGNVNNYQEFNVTFVVSVSSAIPSGTYYLPVLLTWYQPPTMQVMHQMVLIPVTIKPAFSFSLGFPSLSNSDLILITVAVLIVIILAVMVAVGSRRR